MKKLVTAFTTAIMLSAVIAYAQPPVNGREAVCQSRYEADSAAAYAFFDVCMLATPGALCGAMLSQMLLSAQINYINCLHSS